MPSELSVLVVCTGNICRSPAAAALLTRALGDGALVTSAGTAAVVGSAATPQMAALLAGDGLALDGFAARQLTADLVRSADLVVALTRAHRSAVVSLAPAAVRRTFTLRELARLADDAAAHPDAAPGAVPDAASGDAPGAGPGARLRALLPRLAAHRRPHPGGPAADDIEDPFGQSAAVYRRVYGEMAAAVAALSRALGTAGR